MKCSGVKMSVVIALLHALAVSHPDNIIRTGKIPFSLKKKKVSIHFSQPPTHSHRRRRRRMQSGKLLIIAGIKSDSTSSIITVALFCCCCCKGGHQRLPTKTLYSSE
jgi:hypothetical protein